MSGRGLARSATAVALVVALIATAVVLFDRSGTDRAGVVEDATVEASTSTSTSTTEATTTTSSSTTSTSIAPSTTTSAPSTVTTVQSKPTGVEPAAVAAVTANGTAPVIVNLDVQPTGSPAERAAQVGVALDRVLASMPAGSYSAVARDLSVSTIPMTVDRSGLDALAKTVSVESVRASRTFQPSEAEMKPQSGTSSTVTPSSTDATTTMGANTVWGAGNKGAGATVAVIDTGVDKSNSFITATSKTITEGCFGTAYGSYATPCPSGPMSALSIPQVGSAAPCPLQSNVANCAHGTHVAGIAVGGSGTNSVSGIAPASNLVAVSVFTYSTSLGRISADDNDIIRALNWLVNQREAYFPTLAAVNMSLGSSAFFSGSCDFDVLKPSIDALASVGVMTVVAAGNDGWANGVSSPACISSVVAVGATDDTTGQSATFSNDGPQVAVMAPGVSICSSVPTTVGSNCPTPNGSPMAYMSGTSMATPAVAGAVAQLKAANVPSSEWRSRLQRVATGANCVQASAYTIPSLRVDVALGMTAQRVAPCSPSVPAASLASSTSATVSWRSPGAIGTGTLSSYTATANTGQSCTVGAGSTSCVIGGLPAPASITFTVTASSTTGTSGPSIASNAVVTTVPITQMFIPLTPARLADTRSPSVGASTIDGQYLGRGPLGPGATYAIRVLGRGGVPSSGVGAVALNVTATNTSTSSFFTVYPSGAGRPTASSLNFTMWQTVANQVNSGLGGDGAVAVFNALGSADVIVDVVGWYPAGNGYAALQPARLLDTRPGLSTVDGQYNGTGALPQGSALSLVVAGRGGVPGNAGSVVLNVTATNPTTAGFLTVYPRGAALPTASNLNFVAGQTVPNAVIAAVGQSGRVEIFNALGSTDVVVDVVGWMPGGSQYHAMTPARLLDTRPGLSTVDGQYNGIGALPQGAGLPLQITGRAGIPPGARAVVVNVTAANPTWWGFFTVYSTSSPRPTASNLNFSPGQTVPNLVISGVGGDGKIVIFNAIGITDAIVDVVGWYS